MGFCPARIGRRLHKLEKSRRFAVSVVGVRGFRGYTSILVAGANFRLAFRLRGEELRSVWLSRRRLRALRVRLRRIFPPLRFGAFPLRRIVSASRRRFAFHGRRWRFLDLRRSRSFNDGARREFGEVEGVVLELGAAEVCNSEDCQRGSANATPARSADRIALIWIQLTGLASAKQRRSVSGAPLLAIGVHARTLSSRTYGMPAFLNSISRASP